jgi:hypothetical protein
MLPNTARSGNGGGRIRRRDRIRQCGVTPSASHAFCAAVGNRFLAVDHPGRTRDEIMARAANLILDLPLDTPPPTSAPGGASE